MKSALLQLLAVCLLQLLSIEMQAQDWNWAKSFGDSNSNFSIKSISQNSSNDILVLGEFDGSKLVFGTDTIKNNGSTDFFVALADNEANIKWIKNFGGSGSESIIEGVLDKSGNIYIIGQFFELNVIIDTDTIINKGQQDGYIVKLQPNGNVEWTLNVGSIYDDVLTGLVLDSVGNVYVNGYTVNSTIEPIESSSFLIKVNPNKDIEWIRLGNCIGGNLGDTKLTIDDEQNIYYSGSLYGKIKFNDSTEIETDSLINQSFIVKYNSSGVLKKADIINDMIRINDISSFENNLYLCGIKYFINEEQTDSDIMIEIRKYDNQFDTIWSSHILLPDNYGSDFGKLIVIDKKVNTYLGGVFSSDSLYFQTDTLINMKFENGYVLNSFLVKYDSTGKEIWVENIGGELYDEILSMFISDDNEIVIAGQFMSKEIRLGDLIINNDGPLIEWSFHGVTFYFRSMFSFIASLSDINTRIKENKNVSNTLLYPNPTRDYFNIKSDISTEKGGEVNIFTVDGRLAKSISFQPNSTNVFVDTDDLVPGIYIVQFKVGNEVATQRLVKY